MSTSQTCVRRPVLATGNTSPNSSVAETARRFLQGNAPGGAWTAVAFELDFQRDRIYREVEGHSPLSVDMLVAAAHHLDLDQRLRLIDFLVARLGLHVSASATDPIEVAQ